MAVFGVKFRLGLIEEQWERNLFAVIGQELKRHEGVMPIAIGGAKDHVHVLFSTLGKISEADIIRNIKAASSRWINKNRLTVGNFGWQDGSGRFSYSFSQLPQVINYIRNQREHHRRITFREEYESWLMKYEIIPGKYDLPNELI